MELFAFDYNIPLEVRLKIFNKETEKSGPKVLSTAKAKEDKANSKKMVKELKAKVQAIRDKRK